MPAGFITAYILDGDLLRCAVEKSVSCGSKFLRDWYPDSDSRYQALLQQTPTSIALLYPFCDDDLKVRLFRYALLPLTRPELRETLLSQLSLSALQWLFRRLDTLEKCNMLAACLAAGSLGPNLAIHVAGLTNRQDARGWFGSALVGMSYEDRQSVIETVTEITAALPELPAVSVPNGQSTNSVEDVKPNFLESPNTIPAAPVPSEPSVNHTTPHQTEATIRESAAGWQGPSQAPTTSALDSTSSILTGTPSDLPEDDDGIQYTPTRERSQMEPETVPRISFSTPSNENMEPPSRRRKILNGPARDTGLPASRIERHVRKSVAGGMISRQHLSHTSKESQAFNHSDPCTELDPRAIHPSPLPWMTQARQAAAGGERMHHELREREQGIFENSSLAVKYAIGDEERKAEFDWEVRRYFAPFLPQWPTDRRLVTPWLRERMDHAMQRFPDLDMEHPARKHYYGDETWTPRDVRLVTIHASPKTC